MPLWLLFICLYPCYGKFSIGKLSDHGDYQLDIRAYMNLLLFYQLICLYPSEFVSWMAMIGAASASSLFLLRNLAPIIVAQAQQQSALYLSAITWVDLTMIVLIYISSDGTFSV